MKQNITSLINNNKIIIAKQPKNNGSFDSKKLVLIPIDHDYPGGSANMHNSLFKMHNLDYSSVFVVGNPNDIEEIVMSFKKDPRYIGGGVGSGFKDKILPYLDKLDESAKITKSVNVISKRNGQLIGYNTDGIGYVNDLKNYLAENNNSLKGKSVALLGAGGTASAIAYALSQENIDKLYVINRTISKADLIKKQIQEQGFSEIFSYGEESLEDILSQSDIIVNTTNKGADPFKQYSAYAPVGHSLEEHLRQSQKVLSKLKNNVIISDIVLEDSTPTLVMAQQHDYKTHQGKGMNFEQAIPAIKYIVPELEVSDKEIREIFRGAIYES